MFNLNFLKKERAYVKFYFTFFNRPSIIYLYSIRNQPILLVNIFFFFFDLSLHVKSPILYRSYIMNSKTPCTSNRYYIIDTENVSLIIQLIVNKFY